MAQSYNTHASACMEKIEVASRSVVRTPQHNPSARIVHMPPWFYRVFLSEREGGISEKSMSFHYLNEREMFWIWPLYGNRKTPPAVPRVPKL